MAWEDGPKGTWWQRRWCRRAGFSTIIASVIVGFVGLTGGIAAAKDLNGSETEGGRLFVSFTCGPFVVDPDQNAPCQRATARITGVNGAVLDESQGSFAGILPPLEVRGQPARLHLVVEVDGKNWTRDYFVPKGSGVEDHLNVGGASDESPLTSEAIEGRPPGMHLLAFIGVPAAIIGLLAGAAALGMHRYRLALLGPLALLLGMAFTAPTNGIVFITLFVAPTQMLFVWMAAHQFRAQASGEATILLD